MHYEAQKWMDETLYAYSYVKEASLKSLHTV